MKDVTTKLSYGLYIVTTWVDGKPTGCVANCAMQITAIPASFAISINHDNFTAECIRKTGKFAICILAEDSDPSLIGAFGFKSGRDTDKFANVGYTVESRLPIINDSCGFIACDVINTMESETHTVFLGAQVAAEQYGDRKPMTYDYYHNVIKGKSPETAPTYRPETADSAQNAPRKFKCEICGFVYEGDELPEDYVCPICGVGPEHFTEIK